jgi:hypothetical protein
MIIVARETKPWPKKLHLALTDIIMAFYENRGSELFSVTAVRPEQEISYLPMRMTGRVNAITAIRDEIVRMYHDIPSTLKTVSDLLKLLEISVIELERVLGKKEVELGEELALRLCVIEDKHADR